MMNQWCFDTCGRIMHTEQRLPVKVVNEFNWNASKNEFLLSNDYQHPGYVKYDSTSFLIILPNLVFTLQIALVIKCA